MIKRTINKSLSDKTIEQRRYDDRARLRSNNIAGTHDLCGSMAVALSLREPYTVYEDLVAEYAKSSRVALELCAGMGEFTGCLVSNCANVVATDISKDSLDVLRQRFASFQGLYIQTADIEVLKFPDHSFDLVVCAGGLSYGDNMLVMYEIHRVLKPGGRFVCVDSLNNNPIYRLNRYVHYLMGRRSFSTLKRMPKISLLKKYVELFNSVNINYFGGLSWLIAPLAPIIGQRNASIISRVLDKTIKTRYSAFKFVMTATKEL